VRQILPCGNGQRCNLNSVRSARKDKWPPASSKRKRASLSYLTDNAPGIRRIRRAKGFAYILANGKRLPSSSNVFRRIRSLVIPPAWADVWISPLPNSHLQATGRDARGRKQYLYHDAWRNNRDRTKFDRLSLFARALPQIRSRIRRDLRLPGVTREKILATIVRLLDKTLIRVGNDEYVRQNRSYGLTTLRSHHASVHGSTILFSFRGKGGKKHAIQLDDARLARIVRRCQELPGQELFQYIDEAGRPRDIGSRDVNDYIRAITGQEFTAKDFRTWHGTTLALSALRRLRLTSSRASAKQTVAIIKAVAEVLGNTPAVCRKSYIHPAILTACESFTAIPDALRAPRGLSIDECQTLALLLG
jgi:DNA topoisomerase I